MEVYSYFVANVFVVRNSIKKNVELQDCQVLKTYADECIAL